MFMLSVGKVVTVFGFLRLFAWVTTDRSNQRVEDTCWTLTAILFKAEGKRLLKIFVIGDIRKQNCRVSVPVVYNSLISNRANTKLSQSFADFVYLKRIIQYTALTSSPCHSSTEITYLYDLYRWLWSFHQSLVWVRRPAGNCVQYLLSTCHSLPMIH